MKLTFWTGVGVIAGLWIIGALIGVPPKLAGVSATVLVIAIGVIQAIPWVRVRRVLAGILVLVAIGLTAVVIVPRVLRHTSESSRSRLAALDLKGARRMAVAGESQEEALFLFGKHLDSVEAERLRDSLERYRDTLAVRSLNEEERQRLLLFIPRIDTNRTTSRTFMWGTEGLTPAPAPLSPSSSVVPEGGVNDHGSFAIDTRAPFWQRVDFIVPPGATVEFEAEGQFRWDGSVRPAEADPDGAPWLAQTVSAPHQFVLPTERIVCLIGKIGNQTFPIGRGRTVQVTEGGQLELAINERWLPHSWDDNKGQITVKVRMS